MAKFYAVIKGVNTGVFDTWSECQAQVSGFSGALFKSFPTRKMAELAVAHGTTDNSELAAIIRNDTPVKTDHTILIKDDDSKSEYETNSVSVDAACSGNPGVMEYQGVDTLTGEILFSSPIYKKGTNNIGEFLAVVDALRYLHDKDDDSTPIYTDSVSAMAWVRNRQVKTNLKLSDDTKDLWVAITDAIDWLLTHSYDNPILKWDTKEWGESKADFGRK